MKDSYAIFMKKRLPVSAFDRRAYRIIRRSVSRFLSRGAEKYDRKGSLVLDIAPQIHEGAAAYFRKSNVKTLDLDRKSGADYCGDITKKNQSIPSGKFDIVICTEVLEHTLNPFAAAEELRRIVKRGGAVLVTTPYNFRIHGPLPDCWRFTEHGLRLLFRKFRHVEIREVKTPQRNLMPIHYTVLLIK